MQNSLLISRTWFGKVEKDTDMKQAEIEKDPKNENETEPKYTQIKFLLDRIIPARFTPWWQQLSGL